MSGYDITVDNQEVVVSRNSRGKANNQCVEQTQKQLFEARDFSSHNKETEFEQIRALYEGTFKP